jgi:hypothetical protein
MAKKCANRGCQKYARGGDWCATHSATQQLGRQRATTTTTPQASTTKPRVVVDRSSITRGFFKRYIVSQDCFLPIQSFLNSTLLPDLKDDVAKRGVCMVDELKVDEQKLLHPLLVPLISLAKLPLKHWYIVQSSILVAPASSPFSNSWSKGRVHRDFLDETITGTYTFTLFFDEVTASNGAIEFWPNSQWISHDPKNPSRTIVGLQQEIVTGPPRTMIVWDGRILHRSLPNTTPNRRLSLLWTVASSRGLTVNAVN